MYVYTFIIYTYICITDIYQHIYINHCKNMYIHLSTQEIMVSSKNNNLLVTSYIQLLIMKKEKNISFFVCLFYNPCLSAAVINSTAFKKFKVNTILSRLSAYFLSFHGLFPSYCFTLF